MLYVREVGRGAPLVVLHGGPGAHHDYLLPQFDVLADEFHLHYYDQRGGGRSPVTRPAAVSWRDHVADLAALKQVWGLGPLALLGYSWGGLLALLYASERPDDVSVLVLVAPAPAWGDYHSRFREEMERRAAAPEVRLLREELQRSGLRERDPAAYRRRRFDLSVAGYFRDPRAASGLTPFVVQTQAQQATLASLEGHGPALRRKLAALGVPALILHGRRDPIPVEWAEELAGVLPTARLVVLEQSGHVPHVEEREASFREIRLFLREHVLAGDR
jgi:proline iminopeptidase